MSPFPLLKWLSHLKSISKLSDMIASRDSKASNRCVQMVVNQTGGYGSYSVNVLQLQISKNSLFLISDKNPINVILQVFLLQMINCCRMVVVKQGQIALTQNGDEPEILPPGRHVLLLPTNKLIRVFNESEPVIQHCPIKIIQVLRGQLGYTFRFNFLPFLRYESACAIYK